MNEKEKGKNPHRKREKETGISSMIGFDNETSSFLTLLINKAYRKLKKGKLESFELRNKIKTIFCLKSSAQKLISET